MDRFKLEAKIMDCWQVVQDLELIYSRTCENQMDLNEVTNIALGLKTLYGHRFDDLFDCFESCIRAGEFNPRPVTEDCSDQWIPPFLRAEGTE